MRFVVYGAGAVGGVVGGRLHQSGHEVLLIARGAHYERIRDAGLTVESPEGAVTLDIPVVSHPAQAELTTEDVVLIGVKSQHTAEVLDDLVANAPPEIAVACLQNGVANEAAALRLFANVYGICVMCPATHLEPGVVSIGWSPVSGLLDIGRYPEGMDSAGEAIAAALSASTFESIPRDDIMRWKYAKLLMNLGNAVQALCEWDEDAGELAKAARLEGEACLRLVGVDHVSREEDLARRAAGLAGNVPSGAAGPLRSGGSTWQSLARGADSLEVDFLNGEIALLGRLHGVPTPVNEMLQHAARQAVAEGIAPSSMTAEELTARLPS